MNINRHNYEEFFLMYVDNELSASEKASVDLFIRENPDLAPELELLAQTSLPSESFSFDGKDSLIKPESIPTETQEQMILMLDAELDQVSSDKLRQDIAAIPALQAEWNILQQTKLDPADTVIFADKASLYKHSTGRVVSMRFLRMAVAAAILAFGIFLGVKNLGNKNQEEPVLANSGSNPGNKSKASTPAKSIIKDQAQEIPEQGQLADNAPAPSTDPRNLADVKSQKKEVIVIRDQEGTADQNDVRNLAALPDKGNRKNQSTSVSPTVRPDRNNMADDNVRYATNKGSEKKSDTESNFSNNNNVQLTNRVLNPERNQPNLIAEVRPEDKRKEIKPLSALDTDIMQPLTVPDARTAALNPDEEGDKNDILFLDESRVKKSKLSGMFRKLKRTIERKTNIKTGNGVKIAGFEIAVR